MRLGERIHRIERAKSLDRPVAFFKRMVQRLPEGGLRDVLHGVPLGHPLHPLLVQVPIGAWTSAGVLDFFPGTERSSRRLITLGVVAAVPAVVAGAADWAEQHERHQRVGVVHAASNNVALLLYTASLLARSRGHHGWGRALGWTGLGAVGVGGMLGAHIAYHLAGGASHADHVPDRLPEGRHDLGASSDFPDGSPVRAQLGDMQIVVVRSGEDVYALADTCSHMGGPLSQGETDGVCVTCPWHGSTFRLADGGVVNGPATAAQPALDAAVHDGRVIVQRRGDDAAVPRPRAEEAEGAGGASAAELHGAAKNRP